MSKRTKVVLRRIDGTEIVKEFATAKDAADFVMRITSRTFADHPVL